MTTYSFGDIVLVAFLSDQVIDEKLKTAWPNGADSTPEYIDFQAFKNEPELQFKQ